MKAGRNMLLSVALAAVFVVVGAGRANAAPNPTNCTNDIDCVATPTCGGDLCDWEQGLTCKPSGGTNKGWCMADTDCKCAGAKCGTDFHCSKTTMAATGTAGTMGGAAGTGAGTAGTGAGTAGTSATGAAGTSGGGGGGGGCSVASTSTGGLGALLGLALVAGRITRRRRR